MQTKPQKRKNALAAAKTNLEIWQKVLKAKGFGDFINPSRKDKNLLYSGKISIEQLAQRKIAHHQKQLAQLSN